MKNLKKILIVTLALALVLACGIVAAFADDGYTGTVEALTPLVETAEKATTAETIYNAINAIELYLDKTPVDPSAEGYDALVARIDAVILNGAPKLIAAIDANIETTLKTATNRVAINRARRVFIAYNGNGSDLGSYWTQLDLLTDAHEKAVAANLKTLDSTNGISQYDYPKYAEETFETFSVANYDKLSIFRTGNLVEGNKFGVASEGGNKFMYLKCNDGNANTYPFVDLSTYDDVNGYVFSLDLSTFDKIPQLFNVEAGGVNMPFGRNFPAYFFSVKENGDIAVGGGPGGEGERVVLKNAIVPGEWINIMVVFDPEEFNLTIYVDGQKLDTYSAKFQGKVFDYDAGGAHIRFSTKSENGSIAIDNFVFYSGSNYRDFERLIKMNDDEKFLFYTDYLVRPDALIDEVSLSYDRSSEILDKYWVWTDEEGGVGEYTEYANSNPEIKAAVDKFLAFDVAEFRAMVMMDNLQSYVDMVNATDAIPRSAVTDDIAVRSTEIAKIEEFLLKKDGLINLEYDTNLDGTPDYLDAGVTLARLKEEVKYDLNAVMFVRHMYRFEQVTAITAMQRYYERAKVMLADNVIEISIITNSDHPERANFENLIKAYETYLTAYELLDARVKSENSSKIVTCMKFIDCYQTEEEWLENYEVMNKYIDICKPSILGTDENGELLYDPNYAGVSEAVAFFNLTYTFFYNVKQDNHIAYITEILDLVSDTEAYVEKMGMISMVDRYIADNELNYNDARILSLLNALETYRAELQVREEDYGKILVQNSVYFVNIVENMRTADTYEAKKNYFEQASVLYFNIDVTVSGTANAVAIYDHYKQELALLEQSSIAFLEALDYYKACETEEDRYAALVVCYFNAQYVEMSYAGVEEAMAEYEAEYEAYMNYVNAVNEEIVASGNAVGSLRTNCGITPIIAIIIKKIYGV